MKKYLIGCSVLFSLIIQISQAQNVGIGTTTPSEKLQVMGNIKADTVKPNALLITTGAAAAQVLTSDANGNATWQPSVGLTLPYSKKESSNTFLFSINNIYKGISSAIVGIADSSSSASAIRGISATGRAGYFTSTSGKALETSGKLKFAGNGETNGAVLTSDAVGFATWKLPEKMFFKAHGFEVGFNIGGGQNKILNDWKTIDYEIGGNNIFVNNTGELFVLAAGMYRISIKINFRLDSPDYDKWILLNILKNGAVKATSLLQTQGVYATLDVSERRHEEMFITTVLKLEEQDKISFMLENNGRASSASIQFINYTDNGLYNEFTVEKID